MTIVLRRVSRMFAISCVVFSAIHGVRAQDAHGQTTPQAARFDDSPPPANAPSATPSSPPAPSDSAMPSATTPAQTAPMTTTAPAAPAPAPVAPAPTPPPGPPAYYPPYYYYYYPPPGPAPTDAAVARKRLVYPGDRAARTTPFFDLHAGGLLMGNRFSNFLVFSVQVGTFIASRVRVAGRAGVFGADSDIDYVSFPSLPEGFEETDPPEPPSFAFAGSVGYALVSTPGFVLAPGVTFVTTDQGVFGSAAGLSVPFDWVSRSAMRIGFEISLMRAFGGSVRAVCSGFSSTGMATCDQGEVRDFDRPPGTAFYVAFQLGWGLSSPKPKRVAERESNAR